MRIDAALEVELLAAEARGNAWIEQIESDRMNNVMAPDFVSKLDPQFGNFTTETVRSRRRGLSPLEQEARRKRFCNAGDATIAIRAAAQARREERAELLAYQDGGD